MTVLVTGGAGFLGSHLVDRLIRDGKRVIIIDNLLTGSLDNLTQALKTGQAIFMLGDVTMPIDELKRQLAKADAGQLSEIYHLASPASPEAYGAHPWETLQVNGVATMALIDLAIEHRATMFFASTSEVYGDPLVHPQPESYFGNVNPVGPRACYDEGKRFGEAAMSVAIRERGLAGRIMRVFNCYGPRMAIGDGRIIPAFLEALGTNKPLPIHGKGQQTRSMTYVDDLVDGILTVMDHHTTIALPVNLGSEEEKTVLEIARALADVAGRELDIEYLDPRPEDPQRRKPDVTLAKSIGWSAKTALDEGLKQTWAWFLARNVAPV